MADNGNNGSFWRAIGSAAIGLGGSIFAGNQSKKGGEAQAKAAREINAKKLAFQQKMWEQTNRYNTPEAQMRRYIAAGLNPNLIYGRGESGNASMQSVPDLDVPDVGAAYRATAGVPGAMLGFTNEVLNAQFADARRRNVEQDTANKAIDGTIKAVRASSDKLSYKQQQDLYNTAVSTAKKNLERINQTIDIAGQKNTREQRMVDSTVKKLSQELKNLKKKGQILGEEAIIKRIDRELYQKYKLRPNDPYYMRFVSEILDALRSRIPSGIFD